MATWDTADLLARAKRHAVRPSTDERTGDTDWYALFTEAQVHWYHVFATHVPHVLYGAPVQMETDDSGETYRLPAGTGYPIGNMEIRASRSGRLLVPGPEWDPHADFTQEGAIIRIPSGKTRTFSDGPYARFVEMPDPIDASTAPSLTPEHARILIVARALILDAQRGGYGDPSPFERMEQDAWSGSPNLPGDAGILGALKTQYAGSGLPSGASGRWWDGVGG